MECWAADVESRPDFVGGAPGKNILRRLESMIFEYNQTAKASTVA